MPKCSRAQLPNAGNAAFTLLELLVVIALIGILTALMIPAVNSARASAQRTQCLSRIKALGQAALLYAQENDGQLPGGSPAASLTQSSLGQYTAAIVSYLNLTPEQAARQPQYFSCPNRTNGSYTTSNYLLSAGNELGMLGVAGVRLSQIKQPCRTVLIFEGSAAVPFSNHPYTNQNPVPDSKSSLCYVDGHVEFLPIHSPGGGYTVAGDPPANYGYQWSPK